MKQRFLVIQLARFGDLVQTKRLIATLMRRGEVHLCLDRSLDELAGLVFPGVATHPVRAHATGLSRGQGAAEIAAFNLPDMAGLAGLDFDAVFNLNFSGLNFALARLFDPGRVRGYAAQNGQETRDAWADMAFRAARRRTTHGLNLVDFWAMHAPRPLPPAEVNPPAEPKGGGVGVVLAGRSQRRSLPPEVLGPVAGALWSATGRGRLVLLGGPGERRAGEEVMAHIPRIARGAAHNLAGRTDWTGLIEIVSGLDTLLTPDTGTMHLAAHLGTPVTATFLSSAWAFETGPYGEGHTVWQAVADCSPCVESRPCHENVVCRSPFADPSFLKALVRHEAEPLPGLVGLRSVLDPLGVDFAPFSGRIPQAAERRAFRAFMARHAGLDASGEPSAHGLAGEMLLERDWLGGPDLNRPLASE